LVNFVINPRKLFVFDPLAKVSGDGSEQFWLVAAKFSTRLLYGGLKICL
jgi:hypothetical protein